MASARSKGILLTLLAGVAWGIISLFIRTLGKAGLNGLDIGAIRSICSAMVLLAAVPFVDRKALKIRPKDIWCLAGCGLVSITLFNALYFETMQKTTVNIAVVLLYTSPIFVTLFSCLLFGEKFTRWKLLALFLVTAGCVLVSGLADKNAEARLSVTGLLMGLGSGLFYALYSIFGRYSQQRGYNSFTITLWAFLFSGTASLFILDWHTALQALQSPVNCLALAGLVAISTILAYCAYTAGLKLLPPSNAAIIVAVEPLVGTLTGMLVFHEPLSLSAAIGMVLIIGAMFACGK